VQAIQTYYLPPTTHLGSRVRAWTEAKRITVAWDHELDVVANHKRAAEILAHELAWLTRAHLVSGALHDGSYAHVLVMDEN
jgi:hypothetical protein